MGPNPVSIRLEQFLDPFFGFLTHFHLVPILSSRKIIIRKILHGSSLKITNTEKSRDLENEALGPIFRFLQFLQL